MTERLPVLRPCDCSDCPHYPLDCGCPHPWWRHYHWAGVVNRE